MAQPTMQTVVIIDYGSGNLHSAEKAVQRAALAAGGFWSVQVSSDPDVVAAADHIILPGVGAYADCRAGLDAVSGMVEAMTHAVQGRGRPFLGICVGMQLLATRGLEFVTDTQPPTRGLDWIAGDVLPLAPADPTLKIPHMGWNTLDVARSHPILAGIPTGDNGQHAYFVHSFHLIPASTDMLIATVSYGEAVTAAVARDTIVGVQFHPEKSQALGLALLENFLQWRP